MAIKVPVIIINGFLGSGKTTLFRNILSQSKKNNMSVCAIVNDMSELDVDGEIIASSSVVESDKNILESISSDVLSSKTGIKKLDKAINNLLKNKSPDLIVIETSGSCHPMPLIKYFKEHQKVFLTGVLILIDCLMLSHDYKLGENLIPIMKQNIIKGERSTTNLLVEQIMFGSHIILTKSDRIAPNDLNKISNHIEKINPFTSITPIIFGKLTLDSVMEIEKYDFDNVSRLIDELQPMLDSKKNIEKPYNLSSRVIKDDRPFHPERLWEVCHKHLDKKIFRSKGFFWLVSRDDQSLLWNQAAGAINLEIMGTWRAAIIENKKNNLLKEEISFLKERLSKESGRFGDRCCELTIIGDENHIDQFVEKIYSCFLSEKEIIQWKKGFKFNDPWPKKILKLNT